MFHVKHRSLPYAETAEDFAQNILRAKPADQGIQCVASDAQFFRTQIEGLGSVPTSSMQSLRRNRQAGGVSFMRHHSLNALIFVEPSMPADFFRQRIDSFAGYCGHGQKAPSRGSSRSHLV